MSKIFYITAKKLKEVKEDIKKLEKTLSLKTRSESPKSLRSEDVNEEFLLYQENLDLLYSKKRELENILKNHQLIYLPPKQERNKVHLGAKVVVEIEGDKEEFEIVGTLEANPALGKISNESPVGQALMGKKVGEEVTISSAIKMVYKIKKINYQNKKK